MVEVKKLGVELQINDLVSVWWKKKGVRLIEKRPHPNYKKQFGIDGATIGNFDGTEMTIEPDMIHTVFDYSR